MKTILIALWTVILTVASPASAWNGRGHMMVAAVAYNQLTEQTKSRVDELLLLNPDRENWVNDIIPGDTDETTKKMMIFMIAATWADRIKSNPEYITDGTHNGNRPPDGPTATQNIGYEDKFRHKYWHFEDVPFTEDNTPLPTIPVPNLRIQLKTFREVLSSDETTDELKSYDLSWFLHLIGDAHQPLHCTTRVSFTLPGGDDGGNGVKLNSPGPDNLHSFWDGVLGGGNSLTTAINAISSLPAPPVSSANNLDMNHWLDECFEAAQQTVYTTPIGAGAGPFTLTSAYKTGALKLAQKRIALAGTRLAKILNEELR